MKPARNAETKVPGHSQMFSQIREERTLGLYGLYHL